MIDVAFDSLVNQRLNLVLSSDRPLAVQHSALRLLRRLHDTPAVRVAADAPLDPTELIEHVNRIVAGLSIREATDTTTGVERLAVLPVRVNAERAPDSIQLLVRLCRALPGSGLRLILIIEHPPALNACLAALGAAAFHWDIRPAAAADEMPTAPTGDTPTRTQREEPFTGTPVAREPTPPRNAEAPRASDHDLTASTQSTAGPVPIPGMLARIIDSAANRPLRFALWVVGIPGLLIAGALAIGSALQPARAPASGGAAQPVASSSSAQRSTAAKSASVAPRPEEAPGGKAPPTATPASTPASTPVPSSSAAAPSSSVTASSSAAPPAAGASSAVSTPPRSPAAAPAAPQAGQVSSPSTNPVGQSAATHPAQTSAPSGMPNAPAPAKTAAAPTAVAPSAPPAAAAAAPSANTPAGSAATAAASAPPTPPATAQVTAPGATPTAAPAAATAAASAFECTQTTVPVPQAQPRNPSKDGGMVYLTSGKPVIVCVTDGTGALTRAEITPDQSRSFFGKAPWQVQASSLRDLQVFFQGARIPLPRNATDRLELIEQRLN